MDLPTEFIDGSLLFHIETGVPFGYVETKTLLLLKENGFEM